MLALYLVNSLDDAGEGSLREAIALANATDGPDVIEFAAELSGKTIVLASGEMEISDALTIDATGLAQNVTIDANLQSRIFNITATTGDFVLCGLTLRRGRVAGSNNSPHTTFSGGAVRSLTDGELVLDRCVIEENTAIARYSAGGGVFGTGQVTLRKSTVSGNIVAGEYGGGGGGGGIAGGSVTLDESEIRDNIAGGYSVQGGGILSGGTVTLIKSVISGNRTLGDFGWGGGVKGQNVFLTESTVANNSTSGMNAPGGGIFAEYAKVDESIVSGNTTSGDSSKGGGIYGFYSLLITDSTVSGNGTLGDNARGGGIYCRLTVAELFNSTVARNSTAGENAEGGGIWASWALLRNTTVSGNRTMGPDAHGGGISAADIDIIQSTVTDNHALHATSAGGGLRAHLFAPIDIRGSIIAGNSAGNGGEDIRESPVVAFIINYSVVGTGVVPGQGGNNIVTDDPMLAPLEDNGGPTQTHALLPGSAAINAGNPDFDPTDADGSPFTEDPIPYDQRGEPFDRVSGLRIDMGAFELQAVVPELRGDYNGDGRVDAGDYVRWRNTLETTVLEPFAGADGDGNTVVGIEDYQVWKANYGEIVPMLPGGGGLSAEQGAGSTEQGVEHIRISDLGLRIEETEEATSDQGEDNADLFVAPNGVMSLSRGPTVRRVTAVAVAARDEALLTWLSQRYGDRTEYEKESDEPRREPHDEAVSSKHARESLDAVFTALLSSA